MALLTSAAAGHEGKYLLLLSVHGLVRGADIELGRDADTGGQVKYVIELARALGADQRVDRVDVITRQIEDKRVHSSYARPSETLAPGVQIVRLPCGPRRYLRKETLWPHLDGLVDQIIQHVSARRRLPDLIHSHYADAGYVGARLAAILGVPLNEPWKPMIVAVSRPDERKNLHTLVQAYAEHPQLRDLANLVVVAGNRDDLSEMEQGPRQVITDLLLAIDRYDLYGKVAYPKHHRPEDVPDVYRLAVRTHGVFVNPALTEPFGLTLIEAAASGLPVLATKDGGPRDILVNCRNGELIDPLDGTAMGNAIARALTDRKRWRRWSRNGIRGARRVYSWQRHVDEYLNAAQRVLDRQTKRRTRTKPSRLPRIDRLLVCDIDNTLLGDRDAVAALLRHLKTASCEVGFAVATGRRIDSARRVLKDWDVPVPDVYVTAVGSEIHYGPAAVEDRSWRRHIDYRWERERLVAMLDGMPGLKPQPRSEQRLHKISYYVDPKAAPSVRELRRELRKNDLHANIVFSHGKYLDVLPLRASKGTAIRYLSMKWKLPPERMLVAGDSGNDEEMLRGDVLSVVVANHSGELECLRDQARLHFADRPNAWGVLEGLEHFDFLGNIVTHDEERNNDDTAGRRARLG